MTDSTGFVVVCSELFSYKDTCNSMQGVVSEILQGYLIRNTQYVISNT